MATVRRLIVILFTASFLLLALYAGLSWIIVDRALTVQVRPVERVPSDIGLAFEDVAFRPRGDTSLSLRGWWIPADNPKGAVIWVHGLDSARDSHLDLLRSMQMAGFSILTFDLRGHGASDQAQTTAGILEQTDVQGAIDYLLREQRIALGKVGLMGVGLGAAVALSTAPQEVAVGGVFADSSFASIEDLIAREIVDRTPLPRWAAPLMQPGVVRAGEWLKGISIDQIRPEFSTSDIPYPIALIHCTGDNRVPADHAVRIAAQAVEGSALALIEGCGHGGAYDLAPAQYALAAIQYFDTQFLGP